MKINGLPQILSAILISSVISILSFSTQAESEGAFNAKISDNIVYIETFGDWKKGDAKGKFRVVIADGKSKRGVFSEIYIQWLDYSGDAIKVTETSAIVPINRAKIYSLQAPVVLGSDLQFTGRNIYSGDKVSFKLEMEGPGEYEIEFLDAKDVIEPDKKLKGIPAGINSYKRPSF